MHKLGTSINADGQLVVDGLSNLNGGGDAYATPDGRSSSGTVHPLPRRTRSR